MSVPEDETTMATGVKICGLSTPETMEAALAAGADYVGLVFHRASPRHVEIGAARRLAGQARGRAWSVAVTVDAADAEIDRIAAEVGPDYIQAHGSETPERVAAISTRTGIPVIKAIAVADGDDLERAGDYREPAAMILFDTKAPPTLAGGLPGGNGLAFDWELCRKSAVSGRFALSGGLDAGNVGRAIAVTGAAVVDVSSGVERSRGVKDVELIRKFIEAVRRAG
jgi:phosphoribosylanthranilate isomerase